MSNTEDMAVLENFKLDAKPAPKYEPLQGPAQARKKTSRTWTERCGRGSRRAVVR